MELKGCKFSNIRIFGASCIKKGGCFVEIDSCSFSFISGAEAIINNHNEIMKINNSSFSFNHGNNCILKTFDALLLSHNTFSLNQSSYIVYNESAFCRIDNCDLVNNTGISVILSKGSLSVNNCQFIENTSTNSTISSEYPEYFDILNKVDIGNSLFANNYSSGNGGGIEIEFNDFYYEEINISIYKNIFYSNIATNGGALYLAGTVLDSFGTGYNIHVSGNTMKCNSVSGNGGGIYLGCETNDMFSYNFTTIIHQNYVYGNTANRGGGLYVWDNEANPEIVTNNFANNQALEGGGIYYAHGDGLFKGNNICNNSAESGGGIFLAAECDSISLSNSILFNNINDSGNNQLYIQDSPYLFITNCDIKGGYEAFTGPGAAQFNEENYQNCIDAYPLFIEEAPGNSATDTLSITGWQLTPYSPCVNTGTPSINSPGNSHDILGNPRIFDGEFPVVDIGAYELQEDACQVSFLRVLPYSYYFQPQLTSSISQPVEFKMKNFHNDELTIQQIAAPDGFVIKLDENDDYGQLLEDIVIPSTSTIGLICAFAPDEAAFYNDSLEIFFNISDGNTEELDIKLEGPSFNSASFSGSISSDTTWQGEINIDGDVIVDSGVTLQINPSTNILFYGDYTMSVHGQMDATGTEQEQITLRSAYPEIRWDGLKFIDSDNTSGFSRLQNCIIEGVSTPLADSICGYGGGILFSNYENCIVEDCIIRNNSAYIGGGIYCRVNSDVTIKNCSIENNYSQYLGGGISCYQSAPIIADCIIAYNDCSGSEYSRGGGLYCGSNSNLIVRNSIIANNFAHLESGIYVSGSVNGPDTYIGKIRSYSNIICNNVSNLDGALSIREYGQGTVIGNIICNNVSPNCALRNANEESIYLNNIIYNNQTDDSTQVLADDGTDFVNIQFSNIQNGYEGECNIDAAPMFVNPTEGVGIDFDAVQADWRLMPGSPCIDSGTPGDFIIEDSLISILLGYPPFGDAYDMGAYEMEYENIGNTFTISPGKNMVLSAYPNPFNPTTTISFSLAEEQSVSLSIYNIKGQLVNTLIDKNELAAGMHSVAWDGSNNSGSKVGSGIYFVRLEETEEVLFSKILLMK